MVIKWKDEYSLGIREIDEQHKHLVKKICSVEQAMVDKQPWTDIHYEIIELGNYARIHFAFEEALMRMFGVEDVPGHTAAHEHFFIRLSEIDQHLVKKLDYTEEMVGFLQGWLFEHILVTDKKYAEFLLKGVSVVRST